MLGFCLLNLCKLVFRVQAPLRGLGVVRPKADVGFGRGLEISSPQGFNQPIRIKITI